jgi:hypothetical protein
MQWPRQIVQVLPGSPPEMARTCGPKQQNKLHQLLMRLPKLQELQLQPQMLCLPQQWQHKGFNQEQGAQPGQPFQL